MNYNEQFLQFQEAVSQKKSIESKVKELKSQRGELDNKIREYKSIVWDEEIDVERLERFSLSNVLYTLIGKRKDMLNKEEMELCAAQVKYDSAVQELKVLEEDICRMERQLREISRCERQYEALLQEKGVAIKASESAEAEQIRQLEKKIVEQVNRMREIKEAIDAGSKAYSSVRSILSDLETAAVWGNLDVLSDDMTANIVKHSHLDEIQKKVHKLQCELHKFKTELADVKIGADLQISVDGFMRFSDYFFDSLFVDLMVRDKINQTKGKVQGVKTQIELILSKLRNLEAGADQAIKGLENEKASVIVNCESIMVEKSME